jgi:hypothetical protein
VILSHFKGFRIILVVLSLLLSFFFFWVFPRVIMYANSLTGKAFKLYASLPPHSIEAWAEMEEIS